MARTLHVAVLWLCLFATVLRAGAASALIPPIITQHELLTRLQMQTDLLILDVRTPQEFAAGHIPGAVNVPHTVLAEQLAAIQSYQNTEIVVYCEVGARAEKAEYVLRPAGFAKVRHLAGDLAAWRHASLPLEIQAR